MQKYGGPSHCKGHLKDVDRIGRTIQGESNALGRGISGAQPTRANHNLDYRGILGDNYAKHRGDSLYAME
jgi:hypothetical protein